MRVSTFPMSESILPLTFVFVSIVTIESALAIGLSAGEVSQVVILILKDLLAIAL